MRKTDKFTCHSNSADQIFRRDAQNFATLQNWKANGHWRTARRRDTNLSETGGKIFLLERVSSRRKSAPVVVFCQMREYLSPCWKFMQMIFRCSDRSFQWRFVVLLQRRFRNPRSWAENSRSLRSPSTDVVLNFFASAWEFLILGELKKWLLAATVLSKNATVFVNEPNLSSDRLHFSLARLCEVQKNSKWILPEFVGNLCWASEQLGLERSVGTLCPKL